MLTKIHPTSVIYKKLKNLDTPSRVQDFLNGLPFNHEEGGETYRSVEETLKAWEAHCFEGALVASAALLIHGHKPLLLDLRTTDRDIDHVVVMYKVHIKGEKFWGAVSKTNHAALRYRDPVYKSIRELAMSYFNEYFLPDGTKTMRKFSKPFDLSTSKHDWLHSRGSLAPLVRELDRSPHENVVPKGIKLRKADDVEKKAGEMTEWPKKR